VAPTTATFTDMVTPNESKGTQREQCILFTTETRRHGEPFET
jgi:hypothetical protein